MAKIHPVPVPRRGSSSLSGRADLGPDIPVVVLDEAMLATGFLTLRSGVAAVIRGGARALVVDISALERLSSSTVSALLWAQRRCRLGGGSIVLRGASRRILRTLRRTGLGRVFEVESAAGTAELRRVAR